VSNQALQHRACRLSLLLLSLLPSAAAGQQRVEVEAERTAFREWLVSARNSPLAALAQRRLDARVTLGPTDADIPLAGLGAHSLQERDGVVTLTAPDGQSRPLPRGRPVPLPPYILTLSGEPGRTTVTVFQQAQKHKPPEWYAYDPTLVFEGPLAAPTGAETSRVLTPDGLEVQASLVGFAQVPLGKPAARLRVLRMPVPGTEEFELQVYFRDETSGKGTYPAGRFVEVAALGDGRYRVDLNRARNPFCAYSSVYACPLPWPGNTIHAAVTAGEKYLGGGLRLE
jgi:Protein of unknown function (DUF1684)